MDRRTFLQGAALATLAGAAAAKPAAPALVDCHTHFYDPTRPQGVPWPGKDDKRLYRRVLPEEFRKLAGPHGVTGTVVVEASPWLDDNQWLLDLAAKDDFIVGVVGNLDPLAERFEANLRRFGRNRLFRGIRVGHAAVQKGIEQRPFLRGLAQLAELDRALDVNGGPAMPADVARLARQLPELRIVINHAANLRLDGKPPPDAWLKGMRDAARQRHVFCKVSALVEGTGREPAPRERAFYRPVLDALWDIFGEDRLIYGSNWPVSDRFAPYAAVIGIVRTFFEAQGAAAAAKFFRGNAERAYKF